MNNNIFCDKNFNHWKNCSIKNSVEIVEIYKTCVVINEVTCYDGLKKRKFIGFGMIDNFMTTAPQSKWRNKIHKNKFKDSSVYLCWFNCLNLEEITSDWLSKKLRNNLYHYTEKNIIRVIIYVAYFARIVISRF